MKKVICKWFFTLFPFIMIGCQTKVFKNELSQILGMDKVFIVDSNSFDEFGGFGEGYTLESYKLSKKTVQKFCKIKEKNNLYKKNDSNWNKIGWSKSPIDSIYNEISLMGLGYDNGSVWLNEELSKIKDILIKPNNYYSIFYNPNIKNPENAILFILDVEQCKLYIIESNF